MTEENRKRLEDYLRTTTIGNPSKTKALFELFATLLGKEWEKEFDRTIFERGLERMALKSDGIGHVGNLKKFGVMVAEARRKASEEKA